MPRVSSINLLSPPDSGLLLYLYIYTYEAFSSSPNSIAVGTQHNRAQHLPPPCKSLVRPWPMAPLHVVLMLVGLISFSSLYILLGSAAAPPPNGDTLATGQALAAGDKLISRNDKFALGFFRFRQVIGKSTDTTTTITSLGWYLGIWFHKIPICTPCGLLTGRRQSPNPNSVPHGSEYQGMATLWSPSCTSTTISYSGPLMALLPIEQAVAVSFS